MVPIQNVGGPKPPGDPEKPELSRKSSDPAKVPEPESGEDRAEISARGLALIGLRQIPPTRADLVEALKTAINSGRFNLDNALDSAIPGLAEDLRHG